MAWPTRVGLWDNTAWPQDNRTYYTMGQCWAKHRKSKRRSAQDKYQPKGSESQQPIVNGGQSHDISQAVSSVSLDRSGTQHISERENAGRFNYPHIPITSLIQVCCGFSHLQRFFFWCNNHLVYEEEKQVFFIIQAIQSTYFPVLTGSPCAADQYSYTGWCVFSDVDINEHPADCATGNSLFLDSSQPDLSKFTC